jgi:hypothetical protein
MTPLKLARIQTCAACEHRENSSLWPWPRCFAQEPYRELNDTFHENNDCPKGRFEGATMPTMPSTPPQEPLIDRQAIDDMVARRLAVCDACSGRLATGRDCSIKTCATCSKRSRLARLNMACPDDPAKWLPESIPG